MPHSLTLFLRRNGSGVAWTRSVFVPDRESAKSFPEAADKRVIAILAGPNKHRSFRWTRATAGMAAGMVRLAAAGGYKDDQRTLRTSHASPLLSGIRAAPSERSKARWVWAVFVPGSEADWKKAGIGQVVKDYLKTLFQPDSKQIEVRLRESWAGADVRICWDGTDEGIRPEDLNSIADALEAWESDQGGGAEPFEGAGALPEVGVGNGLIPEDQLGDEAERLPILPGVRQGEPSANADAAAVFQRVVGMVRQFIDSEPRMAEMLADSLHSGDPVDRKAVEDLVQGMIAAGLTAVLRALYDCLSRSRDSIPTLKCRELLGALSAMGGDPNWIRGVREKLDSKKGDEGGLMIDVPLGADMQFAEMIKASLFDSMALWERGDTGTPPRGMDGFDARIEPPRPALKSRVAGFLGFVASRLGAKKALQHPLSSEETKDLRGRMKVRWEQRRPLYALISPADTLAEELTNAGNVPLDWVLVFRQSNSAATIVKDQSEVSQWVQDILDLIDPRPAQGGASAV